MRTHGLRSVEQIDVSIRDRGDAQTDRDRMSQRMNHHGIAFRDRSAVDDRKMGMAERDRAHLKHSGIEFDHERGRGCFCIARCRNFLGVDFQNAHIARQAAGNVSSDHHNQGCNGRGACNDYNKETQ